MPAHHSVKEYIIFWLIPVIFLVIFYFRSFFLVLFFSLIIGLSLQSWATVAQSRFKIPFLLAVVIFYLIFAFVIASFIYLALPIIVHQVQTLYNKLPTIFLNLIEKTGDTLPNIFEEIFKDSRGFFLNFGPTFLFKIFGGFMSTILITVLSFYIAINQDFLPQLISIFAKSKEEKLLELLDKVKKRFANWLMGELILMFSVGLTTYIGVLIFDIPFPFLIAFAAGLFEIIPVVGPFISAVIASIITLSFTPNKFFIVLAMFILIQQLENHLLVPLVMKKSISLPPLITLIGIVIGGKVAGVLGVLIVVPLIAFISEIYRTFHPKKTLPTI